MTEKRIINDPIETLALLDVVLGHIESARSVLLPLRLPVATECCYLTSTLDGLRKVRVAIAEAMPDKPAKGGCDEIAET